MNDLEKLSNIGKELAARLGSVGIETADDLRRLGSLNAIQKVTMSNPAAVCLNMLYALEGAIQGIRWHRLSKEKKQELKDFYDGMRREL